MTSLNKSDSKSFKSAENLWGDASADSLGQRKVPNVNLSVVPQGNVIQIHVHLNAREKHHSVNCAEQAEDVAPDTLAAADTQSTASIDDVLRHPSEVLEERPIELLKNIVDLVKIRSLTEGSALAQTYFKRSEFYAKMGLKEGQMREHFKTLAHANFIFPKASNRRGCTCKYTINGGLLSRFPAFFDMAHAANPKVAAAVVLEKQCNAPPPQKEEPTCVSAGSRKERAGLPAKPPEPKSENVVAHLESNTLSKRKRRRASTRFLLHRLVDDDRLCKQIFGYNGAQLSEIGHQMELLSLQERPQQLVSKKLGFLYTWQLKAAFCRFFQIFHPTYECLAMVTGLDTSECQKSVKRLMPLFQSSLSTHQMEMPLFNCNDSLRTVAAFGKIFPEAMPVIIEGLEYFGRHRSGMAKAGLGKHQR